MKLEDNKIDFLSAGGKHTLEIPEDYFYVIDVFEVEKKNLSYWLD
jgi:hypothetical protein